MQIDYWFDFSCPYAYLGHAVAKTRLRSLGASFRFRPMLLGGLFREIGVGEGPLPTLSATRAAYNLADMTRWAEHRSMPFTIPTQPAHPMKTVTALRMALAVEDRFPDFFEAVVSQLFAAYWQHARDVNAESVLTAALASAGIPAAAISEIGAHAASEHIKQRLRDYTSEAKALGVFGAPTFVATKEGQPRELYWGQDRLHLVERLLTDTAVPAVAVDTPPSTARQYVECFFDVASPFAFLALTQLARQWPREVTLLPRPILLGALFREIGTADVPLHTFIPAKQAHVTADLARWAQYWDEPFSFPTKFPQRTVAAQRLIVCATALPKDHHAVPAWLRLAVALGRAMWQTGHDLEDRAVLAAACETAAISPALLETIDAGKAGLYANTSYAKQRGVFGVPTFIVRDRHRAPDGERDAPGPDPANTYWGQDRLPLLLSRLTAGAGARA